MRGDKLNEKDLFLLSMFQEKPGLTMREANAVLRKRFESGVSGAMFARLKRRFEAGPGAADDEAGDEAPAEAAESAPPASAAPEPPAAEPVLQPAPEPVEPRRPPVPAARPATPVQAAPAPRPQVPAGDLRPVRLEVVIQEAQSVHLAGSFDGWRLGERALRREIGDRWVFQGDLPAGEHLFKYLVDGRLWFLDLERERRIDETGVSHPLTVT